MEFVDTVTPQSSADYRNSVWGSKKNLSDSSFQASTDWATMYYQNAYNTALLNYMNEYNSPLNQMLRYQQAGINPNLVAGQVSAGNMDSGHSGAAPKGNFTAPSNVQKQAQAVQTLSTLNQVIGSAVDMYRTMRYGMPLQAQQFSNMQQTGENLGLQYSILNEQLRKYAAEADWAQYWNYPPGEGGLNMQDSPRAKYMQLSTDYKAAQVAQLMTLVDSLYPSQVAANEARAALATYQKEILEGKNDAILDLNTGYPQLDAWLKVILMMFSNMSLGASMKF